MIKPSAFPEVERQVLLRLEDKALGLKPDVRDTTSSKQIAEQGLRIVRELGIEIPAPSRSSPSFKSKNHDC